MENGNLVLTRGIGQSIHINENIVITVGEIKGNQAKLIINAPKDVVVHREEIVSKIKGEDKNYKSELKERKMQAWLNLKDMLYSSLKKCIINDDERIENLMAIATRFRFKKGLYQDITFVTEFLDEFEHDQALGDSCFNHFRRIESGLTIRFEKNKREDSLVTVWE